MRASRLFRYLIVAIVMLASLAPVSMAESRKPVVKFRGPIVSQEGVPGVWTIGEQQVQVTEQTVLYEEEGEAIVGATVTCIAQKSEDGLPIAISIRVLSPADAVKVVNIRGVVTAYEEGVNLVVNGLTIGLEDDTEIIGTVVVGALVKVEARLSAGVYTALAVRVLQTEEHRRFEFEGVVEAKSDAEWTISGRVLAVTSGTSIVGDPQVGDTVWVRAVELSNGTLLALRIVNQIAVPTPDTVEFEGVIQRFPEQIEGLWIVSGRTVFVDDTTIITGTATLGAWAQVVARRQGRGRLEAVSIEIVEPVTETLSGQIVFLPPSRLGRWKISDGENDWVFVTIPTTQITGHPQIGAWADVTVARHGQNGVLVATEIVITDPPDGEVTPEPTVPARPHPTRPHPHSVPNPDSGDEA